MEWKELKTKMILKYITGYPVHRSLCYLTTKTGKYMVSKPLGVSLNITERCNLRCKMCYTWRMNIEKEELSENNILQMISDMKKWGVDRLNISGGEPLLRKNAVYKVLSLCKEYGIQTGLVTNGWLLDKKTADQLMILDLSRLSVSIDGFGDVHDSIRGVKGSFDRAIDALNNINSSKDELEKSCVVHINSVICNENLDMLIDLIDLARRNNSINWFQALHSYDKRTEDPLWIPKHRLDKLNETIDKIIEIKKNEKGIIGNPTKELRSIKRYFKDYVVERDECYAAFDTISINSYGSVLPCWLWNNAGNIKDNDIISIWNSDVYKKSIMDMQKCKHTCMLNCHFAPGSLDSLLYDMVYIPIIRKIYGNNQRRLKNDNVL